MKKILKIINSKYRKLVNFFTRKTKNKKGETMKSIDQLKAIVEEYQKDIVVGRIAENKLPKAVKALEKAIAKNKKKQGKDVNNNSKESLVLDVSDLRPECFDVSDFRPTWLTPTGEPEKKEKKEKRTYKKHTASFEQVQREEAHKEELKRLDAMDTAAIDTLKNGAEDPKEKNALGEPSKRAKRHYTKHKKVICENSEGDGVCGTPKNLTPVEDKKCVSSCADSEDVKDASNALEPKKAKRHYTKHKKVICDNSKEDDSEDKEEKPLYNDLVIDEDEEEDEDQYDDGDEEEEKDGEEDVKDTSNVIEPKKAKRHYTKHKKSARKNVTYDDSKCDDA